jgi:voltage-gated potassium channel
MKTFGIHLVSLMRGGARQRRPAVPFIRYILVLILFVIVYGWLFHVIMEWEGQKHTWFTGIYWALTVMSTLGFGDITFHSDIGRIFSVVVLLTGVVLLLIILPFLFIRMVYTPWQEEQARRRTRSLQSLPPAIFGHVIICASDPISTGLAERLRLADIPSVIIEPDPAVAGTMHDAGIPVLSGEIDSVDTYKAAHIGASRLVFANSSDAMNTNIILTARDQSSSVPIVAIAEDLDSVDVLELAGATHVIPLKHRMGEHLADRVCAGNARASVIGRFKDLVMAEFPVHNTPLQGTRIGDATLVRELGATIVAVWEGGELLPADQDHVLKPLSVLVIVARPEQIDELNEILVIYDANPNPVIVIGGGKVGMAAAKALKERGIPVHVIEKDKWLQRTLEGIPDRLIIGDAANIDVMKSAGISEAPSILVTTHDDAINVFLTVYSRRLNPDARVLTRVTHERSVGAVHRAGSDFVLSYASFGVQTVYSIVSGLEFTMLGEGVDLFYVPVPESLDGRTLADARIGSLTGLNVIAIQQGTKLEMELESSRRLAHGSALLALGNAKQRDQFTYLFERTTARPVSGGGVPAAVQPPMD